MFINKLWNRIGEWDVEEIEILFMIFVVVIPTAIGILIESWLLAPIAIIAFLLGEWAFIDWTKELTDELDYAETFVYKVAWFFASAIPLLYIVGITELVLKNAKSFIAFILRTNWLPVISATGIMIAVIATIIFWLRANKNLAQKRYEERKKKVK